MTIKRLWYFIIWAINRIFSSIGRRIRNTFEVMYQWLYEGVSFTAFILMSLASTLTIVLLIVFDTLMAGGHAVPFILNDKYIVMFYIVVGINLSFWLLSHIVRLYQTYLNEAWDKLKD